MEFVEEINRRKIFGMVTDPDAGNPTLTVVSVKLIFLSAKVMMRYCCTLSNSRMDVAVTINHFHALHRLFLGYGCPCIVSI